MKYNSSYRIRSFVKPTSDNFCLFVHFILIKWVSWKLNIWGLETWRKVVLSHNGFVALQHQYVLWFIFFSNDLIKSKHTLRVVCVMPLFYNWHKIIKHSHFVPIVISFWIKTNNLAIEKSLSQTMKGRMEWMKVNKYFFVDSSKLSIE